MDAKIKQMLDLVREYVKSIFDPLQERVEAVEKRQPEKGDAGTSVTMDDVKAWAAPLLDEWRAAAETRAAEAIAKAAADVPKPKDGQSVTMDQVSDLLKGLFDAWAREADGRIALAVKSAVAEIPKPKDGDPGKDAAPVDVDQIKAQLVEYCAGLASDGQVALEKMLARAVEALPKPKDGDPGKDAEPVDVDAIKAVFAEQYTELAARLDKAVPMMVAQAVAAIPKPKDGKDATTLTVADVTPAIKDMFVSYMPGIVNDLRQQNSVFVQGFLEEAQKSVAAIPPPKNGSDGKSISLDDVMPLYKAWFAEWALGAERSFYEKADRAIAAMPKPKDGISAKDLDLVGRTLRFTFADGTVKEIVTGLPLYRDIYKEGTAYEANDLVTFGGNTWIAVKSGALKKPGEPGNDAWRLAARKGSDGKDLR